MFIDLREYDDGGDCTTGIVVKNDVDLLMECLESEKHHVDDPEPDDGRIQELEPELMCPITYSGRIKTGAKSRLQSSIDKAQSHGNSDDQSIKALFNSYKHYAAVSASSSKGSIIFPDSILMEAAVHFRDATGTQILRNRRRQTFMALCLMYTCMMNGIGPTKNQITEFVQLDSNSLSVGYKMLMEKFGNGGSRLNINMDKTGPISSTIFTRLKFSNNDPIISKLKPAIYDMIELLRDLNVCVHAMHHTKVCAVTLFLIMRYSKVYPELEQENSFASVTTLDKITPDYFCAMCDIRRNTIDLVMYEILQIFDEGPDGDRLISLYRAHELILSYEEEWELIVALGHAES